MSSLEQKKYPIGRFAYGKTYSAKEVKDLIDEIGKFPKQLKKTLKKLKGEEIDTPYRPGGWTVRQVIHHLADSHINAYIRMKLAATEKTPYAKTYEEGLWAELSDGKTGSQKLSVRLLSALHRRWVAFLEGLNDADMKRGYFSPGAGRVLNIDEAIALYAWHGRHHIGHIKLLTGWEPAVSGESAEKGATKKTTTAQVVETSKVPGKGGQKPKAKPEVEAVSTASPTKAKRHRRTNADDAATDDGDIRLLCDRSHARRSLRSGRGLHRAVGVQDLDQAPALAARQGAGLLHANEIARAGALILIVCVELAVGSDDLLELRVAETAFDANDDGLGHLVRDDLPDTFLAVTSNLNWFRHGTNQVVFGEAFEPLRIWVRRVSHQAISFRISRMRWVFSRRAVACWIRRWNSSCRSSRPLAPSSWAVRSFKVL